MNKTPKLKFPPSFWKNLFQTLFSKIIIQSFEKKFPPSFWENLFQTLFSKIIIQSFRKLPKSKIFPLSNKNVFTQF
jgi:hypothetical protein